MFHKIAVAYNESDEAQRALASAIDLAKSLGAELTVITVVPDLPSYIAFAAAAGPSVPRILNEDRVRYYDALVGKARFSAEDSGVPLQTIVLEGPAVNAILTQLSDIKADLLVIGLHQRDLYIARLWSTVYELAQAAPCSVLGVH